MRPQNLSITKGMIPITKNIIVTDERGNKYEATYPKRARGLVKNGRARFIDDNTICLACPPNNINNNFLEDNIMNDYVNYTSANSEGNAVTIEQILERIGSISDNNEHIIEAIGALGNPTVDANRVSEVVREREETNRKMIAMLEKQLNNLTRKNNSHSMEDIKMFADILQNLDLGGCSEDTKELIKSLAKESFGIE